MRRSLILFILIMILIGCEKQEVYKERKVLTNNQLYKVGENIMNHLELPALMILSKDEINDELGVNPDYLESFLVLMPMMRVHSTAIIVFQVKDGKMGTVKAVVDRYLDRYEQYWSAYLSEQHALVKNRLEKTTGNTLIVIVAEDPIAIETIIDTALSE